MSYYLTPNTPFDPTGTPQPGQFGSLGAIHPTTGGAPQGLVSQPNTPASSVLNPTGSTSLANADEIR